MREGIGAAEGMQNICWHMKVSKDLYLYGKCVWSCDKVCTCCAPSERSPLHNSTALCACQASHRGLLASASLGNVYLRCIPSTKCTAPCALAVQHAFAKDAIDNPSCLCVQLQSCVLNSRSGSHADAMPAANVQNLLDYHADLLLSWSCLVH